MKKYLKPAAIGAAGALSANWYRQRDDFQGRLDKAREAEFKRDPKMPQGWVPLSMMIEMLAVAAFSGVVVYAVFPSAGPPKQ